MMVRSLRSVVLGFVCAGLILAAWSACEPAWLRMRAATVSLAVRGQV
jgi:hypothetical protein